LGSSRFFAVGRQHAAGAQRVDLGNQFQLLRGLRVGLGCQQHREDDNTQAKKRVQYSSPCPFRHDESVYSQDAERIRSGDLRIRYTFNILMLN